MIVALALLACHRPEETDAPTAIVHPRLYVTPDQKEATLARLGDEPYATLYARLQATAARDYGEDGDTWDSSVHGNNAEIAHAAAFLAWLDDDEAQATKARAGFDALPTDWETNVDWDVNIRMLDPLLGYCNALDLLEGTPWLPDDERAAAEAKLSEINGKFFDKYVDNDAIRAMVLGPAQNNHPIRTSSAIGYVALTLPDDPNSARWLDFAASEVDYLMNPGGQYVQPDGSVSEGPFYYGFAFTAAVPFSLAMRGALGDRELHRDCRNRQTVPPWDGQTCTESEVFEFRNPLDHDALYQTVDWWIGIRLPSGASPPLEDAYFNALNGGALLSGFRPEGRFVWNWMDNAYDPYETGWGSDLTSAHLVWTDPNVAPTEPDWTTRFFLDGGHAVLRSDWSRDARYLLLTAESGAARMTLHDHVDGTSFQAAAYGEYLVVDPGYYKPSELANAKTSGPTSHNVVLIDGKGAPAKGLLTDFGDVDAALSNPYDGRLVDWIEATQTYEDTTIHRAVAMVRDRYFLVMDDLTTSRTDVRSHAWRLHGNAGYDAGGLFTVRTAGAVFERALAGMDLSLASTAPGLSVAEAPLIAGEPPHVHEFDEHRNVGAHGVIDGTVDAVAPGFLAVLAPYAVGGTGASAPLVVTPLVVADGTVAYHVVGEGTDDVVLLREPASPTTATLAGHTVETDATYAVFGEGFAVFSGGTTLSVDGVERAHGVGFAVTE